MCSSILGPSPVADDPCRPHSSPARRGSRATTTHSRSLDRYITGVSLQVSANMCPVTTLTQRLRARWWRLAAPLLDIRLRPRLRHDPSAPSLMLSPHLDDAVINCWSVLTA